MTILDWFILQHKDIPSTLLKLVTPNKVKDIFMKLKVKNKKSGLADHSISRVLNIDTEKLFSLTDFKPKINVCTN